MRLMSQPLIALAVFSIISGGLSDEARASTGRMWVGSLNSGVWTSDASAIPEEILVELIEADFGVSIAFERVRGNGRGADHDRTLPVAQLEAFFSNNLLTGVLVKSNEVEFPGTLIYLPSRALWSELSAPEAMDRFASVVTAASVLLAGADPEWVDGLAPFVSSPVDDTHKEIFFLADGEPNSRAHGWPSFTLDVISTRSFGFALEDRLSEQGYVVLEPDDVIDHPLIPSKPDLRVITPGGDYEVRLWHESWAAAVEVRQAELKDIVELWSTEPLAPARGLRD